MQRRAFNKGLLLTSLSLGITPELWAQPQKADAMNAKWMMPDESHPHRRTWLAFVADEKIWGADLAPYVKKDLGKIARTIAQHEPVSVLVNPKDHAEAKRLCGDSAQLIDCPIDDLWIRDYGPTFLINQQKQLGALDLNFNGWGNKQRHNHDAKAARFIAQQADALHLTTTLVGEGGGIEVDGHGTAILSESCWLNDNRNPGLAKADFEAILKPLLGLQKIIWLPGMAGGDITDGHTDFYARFATPGTVVAALETDPDVFDFHAIKEHLNILKNARDASGKKLQVITLEPPRRVRKEYDHEDFAAGYINFYVINGAVLAPEFGDRKADEHCHDVLRSQFPKRKIHQLNIDAIAAGGGGIHCATQQEPLVNG